MRGLDALAARALTSRKNVETILDRAARAHACNLPFTAVMLECDAGLEAVECEALESRIRTIARRSGEILALEEKRGLDIDVSIVDIPRGDLVEWWDAANAETIVPLLQASVDDMMTGIGKT